jgi:phosphoenolpyruvate synthase/pyruvate phosphate dikinase
MIVLLKNATEKQIGGQKALNLAILSQKFPVPSGFVITANTFQSFVANSGILKKINELLPTVTENTIQSISTLIQDLILTAQIPEEMIAELHDAYYSLNMEENHSLQEMMDKSHEPFVIVRPSPMHNEKGLHASFVGISGMENLQTTILQCWASFYSEEALAAGINKEPQFAVIVQQMIDSTSSGVLHTSYKMNSQEVLILACKGLGNVLSTGLIVPDRYFITKQSLNIASIEVGKQPFMIEKDKESHKITKVYLQEEFSKKQKISDKHIGELTLYSKEIENVFPRPMEVDFAIFKDTIYFVNCVEAEWLKQKPEIVVASKPLQEMSLEEIEKKEDEISHHITEELEQDLLIAKAAEQQEKQYQEKFIPHVNSDPNDINSLVLSVDFDQLLQETTDLSEVKQESSYVVHDEKNQIPIVTEPVIDTKENIEIKEAKKNTNTLTEFEKITGELIVHCFKEVKSALPQEQWSSSPELRHLAVLAQNYSQKNVAPSPAQVKFAMDAVERVKK